MKRAKVTVIIAYEEDSVGAKEFLDVFRDYEKADDDSDADDGFEVVSSEVEEL